MQILHVSAECFPMAKAGGLADVVGALPKYQNGLHCNASVIMPMHRTRFLENNNWDVVYKASFLFGQQSIDYTIIKESKNVLGFELYCVDVFGILDRASIYGYEDDTDRFLIFQLAVINWLNSKENLPDIIHVHDYHAGLIPFLIKHCFDYRKLSMIKTVLTIHNAQYQGWMPLEKINLFPLFNKEQLGLLEWGDCINPLAAAIKIVDKVTTVSPTYMKELVHQANGLEHLMKQEYAKSTGILNGIDYNFWNPRTDKLIVQKYNSKTFIEGKKNNKQKICSDFHFDESLPLFIFIGRLVGEKAADLLPASILQAYQQFGQQFNFLILGSGEASIESAISEIQQDHVGYYHSQIEYNETLSHQMYAGADFLLMPSRVEPCGLNQLYALRYGTIPIVRRTGGLYDTVIDFGDKNGFGICFNHASVEDIVYSIGRALELYQSSDKVNSLRKKMMTINHSWERSAKDYIDLYNSI
jgi:starch synthase